MFTSIVMINYSRPLRKRLEARKYCGPYRWNPATPGGHRGFYTASTPTEMDRHGSTMRLRLESANEHIHGRLRDTLGYYCDYEGDGDTLQPIIARLPNNRGFLPGWTMGPGMCGSLEAHAYEDAESAALAAHSMAEYDAEESRRANYEYQLTEGQ